MKTNLDKNKKLRVERAKKNLKKIEVDLEKFALPRGTKISRSADQWTDTALLLNSDE